MIDRQIRERVLEALGDTKVVQIAGARQVGKSTLALDLSKREFNPTAIANLDRRAEREAAIGDPEGFLHALGTPALIDEVQRGGPDLILAVKAAVDSDSRAGRFLLTGSVNPLSSRVAPDTLVGRMETVTLWPLAQSEIESGSVNLVDCLFAGSPPEISADEVGRAAFVKRMEAGGFPAARELPPQRRRRWFRTYVAGLVERDLRELSDATRLNELPVLMRLLAARSASLMVYRELGRRLDLDNKTVKAYVLLLQIIYLVRILPGWRPSLASRESATPKIVLTDSGMMAGLLGLDQKRLADDDQVTGRCLETFVIMELVKLLEWSESDADMYHYRFGNDEVDVVLETPAGDVACVEVKSTVSLSRSAWNPMVKLRDRLDDRFKAGFVLHPGERVQPLTDRIWAVPLAALWA